MVEPGPRRRRPSNSAIVTTPEAEPFERRYRMTGGLQREPRTRTGSLAGSLDRFALSS
jgi:hypothetical protein